MIFCIRCGRVRCGPWRTRWGWRGFSTMGGSPVSAGLPPRPQSHTRCETARTRERFRILTLAPSSTHSPTHTLPLSLTHSLILQQVRQGSLRPVADALGVEDFLDNDVLSLQVTPRTWVSPSSVRVGKKYPLPAATGSRQCRPAATGSRQQMPVWLVAQPFKSAKPRDGTSQSKGGTSVHLSNSGTWGTPGSVAVNRARQFGQTIQITQRSPQTVTSKVSTGASKSLYHVRPRIVFFFKKVNQVWPVAEAFGFDEFMDNDVLSRQVKRKGRATSNQK